MGKIKIKLNIMKKVFAFAALSLLVLASCKKDYTCDYGDGDTTTYTGLTKSQATAAESACALGGGTWSKN